MSAADKVPKTMFKHGAAEEWTPERIAKAFGISTNQVYLAKHRMTALIKEEAERIQKEIV